MGIVRITQLTREECDSQMVKTVAPYHSSDLRWLGPFSSKKRLHIASEWQDLNNRGKGRIQLLAQSWEVWLPLRKESVRWKQIYCTEFSAPLEGSWTSIQSVISCLLKGSQFWAVSISIFALSANMNFYKLWRNSKEYLWFVGIFEAQGFPWCTWAVGAGLFDVSHIWLWILAMSLTLCQVKAQGYITSWARRCCSVTQAGSTVWQCWHTVMDSREWKGSLWYIWMTYNICFGHPQPQKDHQNVDVMLKAESRWSLYWHPSAKIAFHCKDSRLERLPSFNTVTWLHGKTTTSLAGLSLHSPPALCWW